MKNIIVQIYEVQTPYEAETLINLGVDHIGSVILSRETWKIPLIKETIDLIDATTSRSSLIPLFSSLDTILRVLDYYRPDMVQFCETLTNQHGISANCEDLIRLQENVKKRFPEIKIIRAIPITQPGMAYLVPTIELARMFEPVRDYFLTDTLLVKESGSFFDFEDQPVKGFVGITGKICDWDMAAKLVKSSGIPVILAGGISPDNVFDGIMKICPAGVDSCTGTNAFDSQGDTIRFKKDPDRVKQLVEEVRRAENVIKIS